MATLESKHEDLPKEEVGGMDKKEVAGCRIPDVGKDVQEVAGPGREIPPSVEEQTIAYFRATPVPRASKDAQRVYDVFNGNRNFNLYSKFMPKGTKLDLTDSVFLEKFDFPMPFNPTPPVKMCGMVKRGTTKPHGLVRFIYEDGNILEATAVDGKFVGLYLRVQAKGDAVFFLVWGPADQIMFLGRVNYKTKDWSQYFEKGPEVKFLKDRIYPAPRCFGAKL